MGKNIVVLILVVTLFLPPAALACTTILVGKNASADGSVMVSHSDVGLSDGRLIYVPAMEHPPGALRPVYYAHCALGYMPQWGASESRRLMTNERGPGYNTPGVPPSVPIGYIPQVAQTYAYFDANYGIMNEHQLSIGECTDLAKVDPLPETGKRMFYSAELSRVALDRCKTAREAVLLMGQLIEQYGYYGTGETLLVGDPNEGWVMEMCGYDLNGTGGVWVAQRVPDSGVFVASNQFRIRDIRKNTDDMMYSKLFSASPKEKAGGNQKRGCSTGRRYMAMANSSSLLLAAPCLARPVTAGAFPESLRLGRRPVHTGLSFFHKAGSESDSGKYLHHSSR